MKSRVIAQIIIDFHASHVSNTKIFYARHALITQIISSHRTLITQIIINFQCIFTSHRLIEQLDEEMLCKCFDKCSKALAMNTG